MRCPAPVTPLGSSDTSDTVCQNNGNLTGVYVGNFRSKCFYNSTFDRKQLEGLIARGKRAVIVGRHVKPTKVLPLRGLNP